MSRAQENIIRFYSKLNELRQEEKYTDVTLQCESKSFKCHRLVLTVASPYFEAMFESSFKENSQESIVLKEVSAATFEDVLQFIYTGNIDIKATNVYDLLKVSDYYNLPGIENLCREFISNTPQIRIQNVFPLYFYACDTNKNDLVIILSKLIAEHFSVYCKLREFLEIPFGNLQTILNFYLSSSKNEELLLTAVIQWTCYKREERSKYLDKFLRMIQFESISPAYYRLMTKLFIAERDPNTDVPVLLTPAACKTALEFKEDAILKIANGLHVYVKYEEENLLRIFTVNNTNKCTNSKEILLTDPNANIRCAVSDDPYLYCLNYSKENQTFCAYTSVDTPVTSTLTPPPVFFTRVFLCYLQNNIYAYNDRHLFLGRTNSKSSEMFNNEEITCGIFLYNCSSDNWFPVPKMKQIVDYACMTVCENTLYLIGGSENPFLASSMHYMQAFDFRAGWRLLPESHDLYQKANCCSLDGKIYVCGGNSNPKSAERYDPVASKWERIQPMDCDAVCHHFTPFDNKLWVMGSHCFEDEKLHYKPSNDLSVNIYDVALNQWSKSSILTDAAAELIVKPTTILESVVFGIF